MSRGLGAGLAGKGEAKPK